MSGLLITLITWYIKAFGKRAARSVARQINKVIDAKPPKTKRRRKRGRPKKKK